MLQFFLKFLFKEIVNGEKYIIQGLLPYIPDVRDFKFSDLGGLFDYKPKHDRLELPILEIKNQLPNNTCVFHSYASCRENDENVPLSPRSLVAYAKQRGYLKSNGISSIRNGQQAGLEFGIAEESLIPNQNLDWNTYSNVNLSQEIKDNAAKHKGKNYFWVSSRNEYLKALDDGHPIHVGFDWYSSYNMRSGFSSPWILPWKRGWVVGGHAVKVCGYDIPQGLFICQNSFGPNWGDNGKFYVRMNDLLKGASPGAVTVDLEGNTLSTFFKSHEGRDVMCNVSPTIFRIQNGKKRPYTNASTFYAWGGSFDKGKETFELISSSLISLLPLGDPMIPQESPFWPKLNSKWVNINGNLDEIKRSISS